MQVNNITPNIIIRSISFWCLAVLALPVYNVLILFILFFPKKIRHLLTVSITFYFSFLLRYVGNIKYSIIGLENLPCCPSIIVSNHQSAWETIVFNTIFPPSVWILKKEILNIPLFGWGIRACSPVAIDRSRGEDALTQIQEQGLEQIKQGLWITVYPEGTRVKPKIRKNFKSGAAKLALKLGCQIVPVAHNAGYCLPKNSFWLYPGTVQIIVNKPESGEGLTSNELIRKVQKIIYTELDAMDA